jgi:hypothetical protein
MTPHSSRILSRPNSPTTPTPKHMPAPMRPRMSDPCNVSMRGFDKLAKSAISPREATNNPVNLLDFRMPSPLANPLPRHEEKEQRNGGDYSHWPKYQLYRTGGL